MPRPLSLAALSQRFFAWLDKECSAGRCAARTVRYYRDQLVPFVASAGGKRPAAGLIAFDLERFKTGWHSVQAVQRLFNWGVKMGLLDRSPFAAVERPRPQGRQRVLTPRESAELLRAAPRAIRRYLIGMRETLARPQEVRALAWEMYDPALRAFVLTEFKGKRRRRDGAKARVIPVSPRLARLLERIRPEGEAAGHVFLNERGRPWTQNAVRCAMRTLRRRLGWPDEGEHVVCYTLRHTAATLATANGVTDRRLADLMGHTSTRTTARYQHLQSDHLHAALDQAQGRRRPA